MARSTAKLEVGPMDYAPETLQSLASPGLLLVSLDGRQRPNVMTIGWGSMGIYWGRPVFIVPVRASRYTYPCLEKTGDFTVNVLPRKLADLAAFCGTVSGRDHDKFGEAVTAVLSLSDPGVEPEAIKAFVKQNLAGYKAPRHVVVVDEVYRSPAGKADFKQTRKVALEALGLL